MITKKVSDPAIIAAFADLVAEIPTGLIEQDFWIIKDSLVVTMSYDEHGRFQGAEVAGHSELADHLRTRDQAWAGAEPFAAWWTRHPDLHRKVAA
ncbi:MAG: DUF6879 family protein [Pseudonocardiaceae bacterium]